MDKQDKERLEGAGDKVAGSVEETIGDLTGNEQAQAEGKAEQVKGDLRQGLADAKDKVNDLIDKVKK